MRLTFLSILTMTISMLSAQEKYMLVGTYTKPNSEGIYVYKFNTNTGEMKKISAAFTENPSYLAFSKDKKYVYAVNESGRGKGGVTAFSFDQSTGRLTKLNQQPSHGDGPCYVAVDNTNKWVAIANYSGGSFAIYPIKSDGSLGEAAQTFQHTGSGPDKDRQEKPHVHSTVFTPDGKYLTVVDLGTDEISFYPFHAGSAKPVGEKPIIVKSDPAAGPRHIIFSPTRPFGYVIEEMSGKVAVISTKNGKFEQIQTIVSHPASDGNDIGSSAIKLSADGKWLYASNRGSSNSITTYSVDGATGKLTLKGTVKSGGKGPRDFAIDPSGKFIVAGNGESDNLTLFKINKSNGLPEPTGKQETVESPVCIVFL